MKKSIPQLLLTLFLTIMMSSSLMGQTIEERLDSTIWTDEVNNRIQQKIIYEYDDQNRVTIHEIHRFSQSTNDVRLNNRTTYTYNDTETIEVYESHSFSTGIFGPSYKLTTFVDENGVIIETTSDSWDASSSSFIPALRNIYTINTDTFRVIERYQWNLTEYQLIGKNEIEYYPSGGNHTVNYDYTNGAFVLGTRSTINIDNATGVETLNNAERYDSNTGDWNKIFENVTTLDIPNYSGVQLSAHMFGGPFEVRDSNLFMYNTDWLLTERIRYAKDDTGAFSLRSRFELDYTEAGNEDEVRVFDYIDGAWQHSRTDRYYYHDNMVSPVVELEESVFPVDLLYQNPSLSNGQVQLRSENPSNQQMLLSITNMGGQVIGQEKVQTGQTIDLGQYSLEAGIYFMTLTIEKQQKTWKVLLQ